MLKTGFRGERKRILSPALSKGEGECSDGKGIVSHTGKWKIRERLREGNRIEQTVRTYLTSDLLINKLANWQFFHIFAKTFNS